MPGGQTLTSRQVRAVPRRRNITSHPDPGASPMSFARMRALVVVGVLAVAAVVFVITALVRDSQGGTTAGGGCPAGAPLADMQLPDDPADVTVRIFNGTNTAGLAERVTNEFKNRRFVTQKPAE